MLSPTVLRVSCLLSKTHTKNILEFDMAFVQIYQFNWTDQRCLGFQMRSRNLSQPIKPHFKIKPLISHCATRFSFVVENQRDAFQRSVTLENCLLLYCTIEGTCTSKIGFDNFPLSTSFIYTRYMWSSFLWFEMFTSKSPLRNCKVKYQNLSYRTRATITRSWLETTLEY